MNTEVEQASRHIQTTVTTSTVASTSGPKISMFARKSGFVIPKNKLLGSLIPVFRGGKKGDNDTVNDESTKPVQRKTKWGPDLTMDTAVRKGKALAYQTRVDQITQQLSSGMLETEDGEDSLSASQVKDRKSANHQLKNEKSELLELERREAIGEILKLNPSFKAPVDYKPLLKEAKVPIPIKEYPGYNFISLVFGPASDTQKRLEKETGAKIRVYGTRADTGTKVEVTSGDGKEINGAYEDLYVDVSADAYEKVDAAVSLIELLVNPVSMNPTPISETLTRASSGNINRSDLSEGPPSSYIPPTMMNQGVAQLNVGPVPAPMPGHFSQYPRPWFPAGSTHAQIHPPSAVVASANPSVPLLSNINQGSPSNPSNMPSTFGPNPVTASSFSSVPQNPSLIPSMSQLPHVLQPPYMLQGPPLSQFGIPRNPPSSLQLGTSLPTPTGPSPMMRPVMSPLPQSAPLPAFFDNPVPSAGEPARWLQSPMSSSTSQGSNNVMLTVPPVVPFQEQSVASHPMVVAGAPPVARLSNASLPFGSSSHLQVVQPPLLPSPTPNLVPGATPILFAVTSPLTPTPSQHGNLGSVSGNAPTIESMQPHSLAAPRPQQPNSSDFTFQPHRQQNLASRPSILPAPQNVKPPNQVLRIPLGPQSPLTQPGLHNPNHPPVQGFMRPPQVSHTVSQPRAQIPMNFTGNPTSPPVPPRHPTFPAHSPISPTMPQTPRNFNPAHPIVNLVGPYPPRAGNLMHHQQNYPSGATYRPPPPQHFSNVPGRPASGSSRAQQTYDPFSPTSVSFNPRMSGGAAKPQQDSDPEYEDLMASVGVK